MTNWEEHYQARNIPWDKGEASPGLVDYLRESPKLGRVLVPGCGMGHDVRALAIAAEEAIGLDVSPSAVAAASALPRVGNERYVAADLFALPEEHRGAYDFIWEHTCFCAIDPARRAEYVAAVAGALRARGEFLGIFYLDPGNARFEDGPPFEVSLAELDSLFDAAFELIHQWPPARTFPGRERREWMRLYRLRA